MTVDSWLGVTKRGERAAPAELATENNANEMGSPAQRLEAASHHEIPDLVGEESHNLPCYPPSLSTLNCPQSTDKLPPTQPRRNMR